MRAPYTPKKIIGIDPGTRITGYGVISFCAPLLQPLDFGCIRPPVHLDAPARYLFLFNGVELLLEKYAPDAVVVETQFVYKNVQSAMKLGMARGMVLLAAARRNIPIFEYAPRKAKQAVTGRGSASKGQVQKMVQHLLCLAEVPEPEDAADALALAICHANVVQFRERMSLCSSTSRGS